MRSVTAVGLGVLIALAIGLLVVFGILAPVFTRVFGLEVGGSMALPTVLLLLRGYGCELPGTRAAPAARHPGRPGGVRHLAGDQPGHRGGHVPRPGDHGDRCVGRRLPDCLLRGCLRRSPPWGGALRLQPEVRPASYAALGVQRAWMPSINRPWASMRAFGCRAGSSISVGSSPVPVRYTLGSSTPSVGSEM